MGVSVPTEGRAADFYEGLRVMQPSVLSSVMMLRLLMAEDKDAELDRILAHWQQCVDAVLAFGRSLNRAFGGRESQ